MSERENYVPVWGDPDPRLLEREQAKTALLLLRMASIPINTLGEFNGRQTAKGKVLCEHAAYCARRD